MRTEWIKCSDGTPESEGLIEVLIGGKRFIGESRIVIEGPCFSNIDEVLFDKIVYEMDKNYVGMNGHEVIVKKGRKWLIPEHFKQPSHWVYIPDSPKED